MAYHFCIGTIKTAIINVRIERCGKKFISIIRDVLSCFSDVYSVATGIIIRKNGELERVQSNYDGVASKCIKIKKVN